MFRTVQRNVPAPADAPRRRSSVRAADRIDSRRRGRQEIAPRVNCRSACPPECMPGPRWSSSALSPKSRCISAATGREVPARPRENISAGPLPRAVAHAHPKSRPCTTGGSISRGVSRPGTIGPESISRSRRVNFSFIACAGLGKRAASASASLQVCGANLPGRAGWVSAFGGSLTFDFLVDATVARTDFLAKRKPTMRND